MQVIMPEFAKNFQCAAGSCPDTCCQGWEIIIDPDTLNFYQQLEGGLGEAARDAIIYEEEPFFRFSANGTCALLDENGLCKLQKELGEEAQCRVCRTYPRFVRQYGGLREEGVSLSCPEAVRALLSDETPVKLISEERDFAIEPNELDPDVFLALKRSRQTAFCLVQDRRCTFRQRLFLLICFAEDVQYCLSNEFYQRIDRVIRRYSSPVGRAAVLKRQTDIKYHSNARSRLIASWAEFYNGLEILSPKWNKLLSTLAGASCTAEERQRFEKETRQTGYAYEHILFATLFKYWLEAADDGILLPKVQQAVVSVLLLRELDLLQWVQTGSFDTIEHAHRIARETEHNEDNLEEMRRAFLSDGRFSPASIRLVI